MDKTILRKQLPKIIMLVLVLIIVILLLVLGWFIFSYATGTQLFDFNKNTDHTTTETQTDTDSDSEPTDTNNSSNETDNSTESSDTENNALEVFTGSYLQAESPEGWKIIEYVDGNGTDDLFPNNTYTGVTAIEIKNPDNKTIFKMTAIDGIGGTAACPEYYKFADTPSSYYATVKQLSEDIGVTPSVIDLSAKDYTSFNFFDRKTRRVDHTLYWDTEVSSNTFETSCGISQAIWNFETLKYQADGMESSAYQIYINPIATLSELETMDAILDSIQPAN